MIDTHGVSGRRNISGRMLIGAIVGVLLLLLCCGGGAVMGVLNSIQNGYETEHELTETYDRARLKLAECIDTTVQAAGFTKAQAEAMTKALVAANGGEGMMGASATPTGFSAIIVKQMPELKPYAEAFERGFNTVIGCRQDYTKKQELLVNKIKIYKDWKSSPATVATWFKDWPSEELVANNGTDVVTGPKAFVRINQIVTNTGTKGAYKDGTYDAPDPFASGGAPTPASPTSSPR